MIRSISRTQPKFTGKEDVIVLPVFEGERQLHGPARKLDVLSRSAVSNSLKQQHFSATAGETLLLAQHLPKAPRHILFLGMGKKNALDVERAASTGGVASKTLKRHRFESCHLLLDEVLQEDASLLHGFLKGFLLAQYVFSMTAKKPRTKTVKKLTIMTDNGRRLAQVVRDVRIVVEHTAKVRDLVNTPANVLTPKTMADEATAFAKANGVFCKVMGPREIDKLGMGAVKAVAEGSQEEPRFITLHYNKNKPRLPKVCLVGKGVTFDSGGISIKPWQNMNEMKGDMAGGALVMSVMAAVPKLKLPLEIIGLVPCVENLPDGTAFRPGDVIRTYSGKTIEIISTDAEGRLILSDALGYAREFKPDVIIDYATLTGAVVVALGTRIAGAMGNSQKHIDQLIAAGKLAGEPVWQLPLDQHFSEMVKGDISDYKNYSGRDASSITAAALLGEFVGKTPWVHVDIAGTFWSESGAVSYHSKGATGYGVDLTLRFLELLAEDAG